MTERNSRPSPHGTTPSLRSSLFLGLLAGSLGLLAPACEADHSAGHEAPGPAAGAEPPTAPARPLVAARPPAQARARGKRQPRKYSKKIREIRARLAAKAPDSRFHIVVEEPFVVIGDDSLEEVQRRAEHTVRWSVNRLKKAYFTRDPERVLEIWLFASKDSYRRHTKAIFNDEPDTPYGYYSSDDDALIMNISTGGGTLVHEIVHPYIEANFPNCPSWFNEGLGSLYEASSDRDGHIVGVTNWRLPGLQEALRANAVPSFRALTATTTEEFYDEDPGSNYSQARYLLYYLQENGLLHDYYEQFYRNRRRDPTGYKTLVKVLGEKDMNAFFRRWRAYTLRLRWR